ncbi:DUF1801 domain-containing protein [Nitrincola sp. MINF-07-Sa-05]|uniref:DUF1801 domain-containing protein n=1 Tax=Nitrincola salilacus TaxID=3400273 RepID=UPI003917E451
MSKTRIDSFLSDIRLISSEQADIVESLREMALSTSRTVSEEIKYGGILFSDPTPFCGVFSYKQHVTLELSNGAGLNDEFGVLEGSGKTRRHIKFLTVAEIEIKHAREYIIQAHQNAQNDA